MNNQDVVEVRATFKTYEEMYELLSNNDFSCVHKELGANRYPQIEWMIEYFQNKEEYEKCNFLLKLELSMFKTEQDDSSNSMDGK